MNEPVREIIFGFFPFPTLIHLKYRQLLKRAGLPHSRKDQFQKLRRSVASHVQAAGYDASVVLAHSSPEITWRSYLDPSIVGAIRPSKVLFRLGEIGG